MAPYGLAHAVPLPTSFSSSLPGVSYDSARQISTVGGEAAVENPDMLAQWAVTWGDTKDGDTVI